MLNRQGRPSSAGEAGTTAHPTFTGNKALAQVEPLLFEIGRYDTTGVDLDEPEDFTAAPRRAGAQGGHRPAGPLRARDHAPLRAPQPEELRHRYGPLPARLLHHEAQCAPQRAHGAPAGLRRRASAAAGLDRAGRAGAHGRARALSDHAHQHDGRGALAEGRRPWRALRHDGDQGRHRGEGRRRDAQRGAGARFGAWHEPGDRRAHRLQGEARAGARGRLGACGGREGACSAPTWRRSCSPTPTPAASSSRRWRRSRRRSTMRALTSTATAPTSTPSSARRGPAISASMPCTSTCTRPSRRRMAAAARAPVRWCSPRASRPSRRCRSCAPARTASSWWSRKAMRRRSRSAA